MLSMEVLYRGHLAREFGNVVILSSKIPMSKKKRLNIVFTEKNGRIPGFPGDREIIPYW
jgi:hypothetical protein